MVVVYGVISLQDVDVALRQEVEIELELLFGFMCISDLKLTRPTGPSVELSSRSSDCSKSSVVGAPPGVVGFMNSKTHMGI